MWGTEYKLEETYLWKKALDWLKHCAAVHPQKAAHRCRQETLHSNRSWFIQYSLDQITLTSLWEKFAYEVLRLCCFWKPDWCCCFQWDIVQERERSINTHLHASTLSILCRAGYCSTVYKTDSDTNTLTSVPVPELFFPHFLNDFLPNNFFFFNSNFMKSVFTRLH